MASEAVLQAPRSLPQLPPEMGELEDRKGPRRVLVTPPRRGRSTKEIDVVKRTPGPRPGTHCGGCGRSKADEPEKFRIRRRSGREALNCTCKTCESEQRRAKAEKQEADDQRCTVDGCDRPIWSRDWCNVHYNRWRNTGDVGPAQIRRRGDGTDVCDFPDCRRPHLSKGLCAGHYSQRAAGKALRPLRVSPDPSARDADGRKCCTVCLKWSTLDAFNRRSASQDGLSFACKRCSKSSGLARRFGIDLDQYEAMLAAQGHGCAICKKTEKANGRMLAVDHDHACCPGDRACGGCVRGLLCSNCNLQLGLMADRVEYLESAVAYLRSTRTNRRGLQADGNAA